MKLLSLSLFILLLLASLPSRGQSEEPQEEPDTCSVYYVFDEVSAEFYKELPMEISSSGIYFDSLNNRYFEVHGMKMRAASLAMEEMSCTERYEYLRKNYFKVKSIYPEEIELDFTIDELSTKTWERINCYGQPEKKYQQVDSLHITWTEYLNDSLRLKFNIFNKEPIPMGPALIEVNCIDSVELEIEIFRDDSWATSKAMALNEIDINCFFECLMVVEYDEKSGEAIILFKNSMEGSEYHTLFSLFKIFLFDQEKSYRMITNMGVSSEI